MFIGFPGGKSTLKCNERLGLQLLKSQVRRTFLEYFTLTFESRVSKKIAECCLDLS